MKYPNRYAHPFRADRNIKACSKCKNREIISFSFHFVRQSSTNSAQNDGVKCVIAVRHLVYRVTDCSLNHLKC